MKKQNLWLALVVLIFFVVGAGGYYYYKNLSYTSVSNIIKHPREYYGKKVRIKGHVVDIFSLTFLSYFEITDGRDTIAVYTRKPLPAVGENLVVTGNVKYITLGTTQIVAIEEQ